MGLFNLFHAKGLPSGVSIAELRPRGDSYVRIDGRDYTLRAWSPGGFSISPYSGGLVAGQIATVRFVVHDYHDRDGALRVEDRVRIESIDEAGLRARWWHLSERKKVEIAKYFALKVAARG
jgi:hypothetical protein